MTDNGKIVYHIETHRTAIIISTDRNGVGDKWYTIQFEDGTKTWCHEDKVKFIPPHN